jgi:putative transposase
VVKRGLRGVRLVVSDAHEGLKQAIGTVLTGATWQRCRVHFMRNLLARVPRSAREAIAAIVRTIFAQPDHASALAQLKKVADGVRSRFAKAATLLEEAAEDIPVQETFLGRSTCKKWPCISARTPATDSRW